MGASSPSCDSGAMASPAPLHPGKHADPQNVVFPLDSPQVAAAGEGGFAGDGGGEFAAAAGGDFAAAGAAPAGLGVCEGQGL